VRMVISNPTPTATQVGPRGHPIPASVVSDGAHLDGQTSGVVVGTTETIAGGG
jgi:hypothetical protein